MKTIALVFAWVPLMMAVMAHGPGGAHYVLWSSLLFCVGIEICAATFRHHADLSKAECRADLAARIRSSTSDSELRQSVSALIMFDLRGAA